MLQKNCWITVERLGK